MKYHFVFCPKRRRNVLVNAVKDRLEELILEKAKEIDCQLLELAIRPDHVHHLLNLPSLWTRSYWVSIAGHVSSDTIQRYIEEQDK